VENNAQPSGNSLSLDAAIKESAAYFIAGLARGSKIAITGFDAESLALSDYVVEELWSYFEQSGKCEMIDRQNLARIQNELNFQANGAVDDDSAQRIGHLYGPQTIVYGKLTPLGVAQQSAEYRLTLYATDVEQGVSRQQTKTVILESRWNTASGPYNLDEQIDRAVYELAKGIEQQTTIAIGRISYQGSLTTFSDFLKQRISYSASRRYTKYRVASDTLSNEYAVLAVSARGLAVEDGAGPSVPLNTAIQGVVEGSFTPLGEDAEVVLQLVSTGPDRATLGSGKFIIPGAELRRRNLSVLPPKGGAVISKVEFDAKQSILEPYNGKNNAFTLSVSPDDLDGIYYDGEYMTLRLYAARDCYFQITHVDVDGNTQVIYPSSSRDNNFIHAGEMRQIPDNTRFRLRAPFGEEYILVAAYDRPFTPAGSGATPLSDSAVARGMDVLGGDAPVATAKFSYTILPKQ
jgi:hypothetical protein